MIVASHGRRDVVLVDVPCFPTGGLAGPAQADLAVRRAAVLGPVLGRPPPGAVHDAGVPVVPAAAPPAGHMGVLPSAVGPEPVAGFRPAVCRVAAVHRKPKDRWTDADRRFVDEC